ncbi:hypothetical protein COLO4_05226 [Corchorus olitorius]|uniref:Uncharacterized protein n=1 Tax=Corchorus olitorius TaxID=93759 RepID=A0A1R3KRL1_9ROSI|nr:hypothetical protein COLO4_05226 [Corchorus olitorius]
MNIQTRNPEITIAAHRGATTGNANLRLTV